MRNPYTHGDNVDITKLTEEQIAEITRRHQERVAREAVLVKNKGRDWTREAKVRWRLYNARKKR